jgi:hypothetical protein
MTPAAPAQAGGAFSLTEVTLEAQRECSEKPRQSHCPRTRLTILLVPQLQVTPANV